MFCYGVICTENKQIMKRNLKPKERNEIATNRKKKKSFVNMNAE